MHYTKYSNLNYFGGFLKRPLYRDQNNEYYFSFRSALAKIIEICDIRELYLPVYFCHDVTKYIRKLKLRIKFYNIDENFLPELDQLPPKSKLLYVNYFGICDIQVKEVITKYSEENVILDLSQRLWMDTKCFAKLNSIRKFAAVADGSRLQVEADNIDIRNKGLEPKVSLEHIMNPEQGLSYEKYLVHERSFAKRANQNMSTATELVLQNIDMSHLAFTRHRNFTLVDGLLKQYNAIDYESLPECPLCYPFLPKLDLNKQELIERRIYTPTYWPIISGLTYSEFEMQLVDKCLFIPVDQRYNTDEIVKNCELVIGLLEEKYATRG